ncbi:MAG: GNAT family N-acetyltransferase [Acidobacteriota bacterium]
MSERSLDRDALRSAVEENMAHFVRTWNQWHGLELIDDGQILQTVCPVPYPLFNNISRARIDDGAPDEAIDAILERSHRPLMWWVGPSARPTDLADRLQERGLMPGGNLPGMARDLKSFEDPDGLPEGVSVLRVDDDELLEAWCVVGGVGFEFPDFATGPFLELFRALGVAPPWHHYVALVEGEPVATASLFEGAGVAGVYNVSTLPEERRKGYAAAISRFVLTEAKSLGYRYATLQSTPMAVALYEGLGFETVCDLEVYVGMPDE